jgi:hypothetical protein
MQNITKMMKIIYGANSIASLSCGIWTISPLSSYQKCLPFFANCQSQKNTFKTTQKHKMYGQNPRKITNTRVICSSIVVDTIARINSVYITKYISSYKLCIIAYSFLTFSDFFPALFSRAFCVSSTLEFITHGVCFNRSGDEFFVLYSWTLFVVKFRNGI